MPTTVACTFKPNQVFRYSNSAEQAFILNECAKAGLSRSKPDSRCIGHEDGFNAIVILSDMSIQETHSNWFMYDFVYEQTIELIDVKDVKAGVYK